VIASLINRRFDRDRAPNRDGDFHGLDFDSVNALGMSGSRITVHQKPTVLSAETGLPIQVTRTWVSLVGSNRMVANRGLQDIITSIFADVQIMFP
jgi:hypothetical protein